MKKGASLFNKPPSLNVSSNFKKIGNNIIKENLKIKTVINTTNIANSPKRLLTNGVDNDKLNPHSTLNKINHNTKSSLANKNKFISTLKSKHNSLANAGNSNNLKPIMLTTFSMKKDTINSNFHKKNNTSNDKNNKLLSKNYNETFSEAKNTKKNNFYKSHNSIIKKDNSGSFSNNKNDNKIRNTDSNLKIMSSSLNKKEKIEKIFYNNNDIFKNSSSANFKSSFTNRKSLEIADLSIIKPSPENELRMGLLNKKGLENSPENYLQKIRKIRSLDNKLVDKREIIFNKIYSFNTKFNKLLKKEQAKNFDSLYDYQNNIVQFIAEKTSMDNLRNLSLKLKTVREINDCYNPVNKVNWKLFGKIMRECKNEMKHIKERSYGGESDAIKKTEQFKKELGLNKKKQINLNKKFSKYESSLKRISPYIPEYLVEKFTKSLKIIN